MFGRGTLPLSMVHQLEEEAWKRDDALFTSRKRLLGDGTIHCLPVGGGCLERRSCTIYQLEDDAWRKYHALFTSWRMQLRRGILD